MASFAPDYFEDFYRAVRESDADAAALVRSGRRRARPDSLRRRNP